MDGLSGGSKRSCIVLHEVHGWLLIFIRAWQVDPILSWDVRTERCFILPLDSGTNCCVKYVSGLSTTRSSVLTYTSRVQVDFLVE